jgi:hypothetical protein
MSVENHGGMILRGETEELKRKSCPSSNFSTINPTWTDPVANPGLRSEKPATNRLSYVIAQTNVLTKY